ncbi:hypothetical protein Tco_0501406, partial [Tanacetum coccineum]
SSDVVELKDMVRALILDKKNQTPAKVNELKIALGLVSGTAL